MRVVVAYSRPERAKKYKDSLKGAHRLGLEIVDAFSGAGAPPRGWGELVAAADGLLLTGGADVEPWRYGETVHPDAGVESVPERDEMEWSLLQVARERRLPVFAICRGHQAVNAFLGGTLWQDLGERGPESKRLHDADDPDRRRLAHGLEAGRGSDPFSELFRRSAPLAVNSLHHQAVRTPAEGLEVVASSPDGVIEAVTWSDPSWWLWSVQWHPEELVEPGDHPLHRTLFERFLAAAESFARRPLAVGR